MTMQFVHNMVPVRRGLVTDPEGKHYRQMRQAVWLYLYLLLAANQATGVRLLSPAAIAREMGISEATVRSWLGHLRKAGYVTVRREAGLVRVRITKWRKTVHRSESDQKAASTSVPLSKRLAAKALAKALGCDPDEPFLKEVTAEHDAGQLQGILDKVLEVPKDRIKKSRLALFRYLINKRLRS